MKLPEIGVKRPVTTAMIFIAILFTWSGIPKDVTTRLDARN